MRRALVCIAIAALLVSHASVAGAGICLAERVKRDDPYAYTAALVAALGAAKEGLSRVDTSTDDDAPLEAAREFMTNMKLAQRDFGCATSHLTGYVASNNLAIKTSAKGAVFVFMTVRDINKKSVAYYRDLLDGKIAADKVGSLADELAEVSVRLDEVWKTLPLATIAATHALVKFDDSGRGSGRLLLTQAQRRQLMSQLHDTFGADIEGGVQTGQTSLVAAAAILYEFLGNAEWKSAE